MVRPRKPPHRFEIPRLYESRYEQMPNGFWKKIRRAVKKVGKAVGKAGKAVGKAGKAVGKTAKKVGREIGKVPRQVAKMISYTKVTGVNTPIRISALRKLSNSKQYSFNDINSASSQIARTFGLDATSIKNFLKLAKLSRNAKRIFNNFAMDINAKDGRYRFGQLRASVIKVSGSTISVNEVQGKCNIYADFTRTKRHSSFGGIISRKSVSRTWRALTPSELGTVYTRVQNHVQADINRLASA